MLLELGRSATQPTLYRALKERAMTSRIERGVRGTVLLSVLLFALSLLVAPAHAQNALQGGPKGVVKSNKGDLGLRHS